MGIMALTLPTIEMPRVQKVRLRESLACFAYGKGPGQAYATSGTEIVADAGKHALDGLGRFGDFLLSARKEAVKAAFSQSAVLGDARYAGPFELVTPENFPKNRNDILTLCDRSSLQLFPVG